MRIRQITFSPTGGTLRVCEALCEGLGTIATATELCVPADEVAVPTVGPSDLVVVGMPVYAGRVPALAVERLRCVETHGARCVVVAVYGNRAYEDALVEMRDVATAMGFRVVAAVAVIAEHSICRMYGAGRPDEADAHELAAFGAAIRNAMERKEPSHPLVVPGNRPYKQGCTGPFPKANDLCTGCGTCASQCPVGAIAPAHPQEVNPDLCIGCMRCVAVCPVLARGIGERLHMLESHLEPLCRERKKNELFL